MRLKQGDVVCFTQEDGNRLTLIVLSNGIGVKADAVGTELSVKRDSDFVIGVRAVNRPDKEGVIAAIRKESLDLPCEIYPIVLNDFDLMSLSENRLGEMPLERLSKVLERIRLENKLDRVRSGV